MNAFRLVSTTLTILLVAVSGARAGSVEVTWSGDAAQYRDIARDSMDSSTDFTHISADFQPIWQELAERYVAEGCVLKVVIEDLDLAGEFEPWRGAGWQDVRIVRSIYPPAIRFGWSLVDAQGAVVGEGKADLRDLGFDLRAPVFRFNREFEYEREMLRDWFVYEIRGKGSAVAKQ